jgi:hypothetical protein
MPTIGFGDQQGFELRGGSRGGPEQEDEREPKGAEEFWFHRQK